jgi:hypothetical protein
LERKRVGCLTDYEERRDGGSVGYQVQGSRPLADDLRQPPAGIEFSYSRAPWGPWSEPQIVFNAVRDGAVGKFIHNPHDSPDDGLAGPVIGIGKANPGAVHGGAYAPFVVERWTKVRGSELDLYYVLSTWNPYVVVLMKSRLQVE